MENFIYLFIILLNILFYFKYAGKIKPLDIKKHHLLKKVSEKHLIRHEIV
jgi:hypothetical protein